MSRPTVRMSQLDVFPKWWNVQPHHYHKFVALRIFTTRDLIISANGLHHDHDSTIAVSTPISQMHAFLNANVGFDVRMRHCFAHKDEPDVQVRRRPTGKIIIHTPEKRFAPLQSHEFPALNMPHYTSGSVAKSTTYTVEDHHDATNNVYKWTRKELDFDIPEFECPLSLETFKDPVVASDGITYERANIEEWLKHSNISPCTGVVISDTLYPTHTFKSYLRRVTS